MDGHASVLLVKPKHGNIVAQMLGKARGKRASMEDGGWTMAKRSAIYVVRGDQAVLGIQHGNETALKFERSRLGLPAEFAE
jgi:hypothetical protein